MRHPKPAIVLRAAHIRDHRQTEHSSVQQQIDANPMSPEKLICEDRENRDEK
jgi:hypothetical protein